MSYDNIYAWRYNITAGITPVSKVHFKEVLSNIDIVRKNIIRHKSGTNHPLVDIDGKYSGFLRAKDVSTLENLDNLLTKAANDVKSTISASVSGIAVMLNNKNTGGITGSWKPTLSGTPCIGASTVSGYSHNSNVSVAGVSTSSSYKYLDIPIVKYKESD